MLNHLHHIAIICSDYTTSRRFYTEVLGLQVIREVFREERQSYKLDLALQGHYVIELFSFPNPPPRLSRPEGSGLRHLSFWVGDLDNTVETLNAKGVETEPIRIDEHTGCRFTFFFDPDRLPIEIYGN